MNEGWLAATITGIGYGIVNGGIGVIIIIIVHGVWMLINP